MIIDKGPVEYSGSMTIKDFHELKVWQKAHQWTLAIYQTTAMFPRDEFYGLTRSLPFPDLFPPQ